MGPMSNIVPLPQGLLLQVSGYVTEMTMIDQIRVYSNHSGVKLHLG
jgi:hypothetical protein